MGLDMFAYATESDIPLIDFDCPEDRSGLHSAIPIAHFRVE